VKKLQLPVAISRIRDRGALLVFPINNQDLPRSLWSEFFPKSRMIWDWNEDGDRRVAELWQLMKELSDCRGVVYSKWFRSRATFFSRELFAAMLCLRGTTHYDRHSLAREARTILEVLENNSPLSTRELKRATGLDGRVHEPAYSRGMKELFTRLIIVGFGEVDDGAFPSAAVGTTELLFSDLWSEAAEMKYSRAKAAVDQFLPEGSHFRRFLDRTNLRPKLEKRTRNADGK
jgi:DNA-binding Lrp family transcriptional regulator